MEEFNLDGNEYIELNKLLKLTKMVDSGGEANIRIVNGEVNVNGIVETRKRHKVRQGFIVSFDNKTIQVL